MKSLELLRKILSREAEEISKTMSYLLATGNVRTKELTEIPQVHFLFTLASLFCIIVI